MRAHTTTVIGLLAAMLGPLGCVSEHHAARTDGTCFIGGCAAEVCSDRDDVVSPCIWRDAYACFRDATCARQPDGACGWTPTTELESCLASHDPLPGSPPGLQR
jgi:eight-cysteine-cluster-containing protein